MPTVVFTRTCTVCGKEHTFEVDAEKFYRWREEGELIQNVWPEKSVEERETMISGTCDPCFKKLFAGSEW